MKNPSHLINQQLIRTASNHVYIINSIRENENKHGASQVYLLMENVFYEVHVNTIVLIIRRF